MKKCKQGVYYFVACCADETYIDCSKKLQKHMVLKI